MGAGKSASAFKDLIKASLRSLSRLSGAALKGFFSKEVVRKEVRKILIFQTGGIGDVLRIFPLIEAARAEFPHAEITALTELDPRIFELLPRKALDGSLRLDFKAQSFREKMRFILRQRSEGYDLVLSPSRGSGMTECSIIAFLMGRRWRAGFYSNGIGFLYTNRVEFRDDEPIASQNLKILRSVGANEENTKDAAIRLHIPSGAMAFAEDALKDAPGMVVSMSPVTHRGLFGWPVENFAALARALVERKEACIVLLGGKQDRWVSELFARTLGRDFKDLIGKTSIPEASAVIRMSSLFVGNDSGLLHVACALDVPSVGIFGPTSPQQVLGAGARTAAVSKPFPCSPCYLHQPDLRPRCENGVICLKAISVEEVLDAACGLGL